MSRWLMGEDFNVSLRVLLSFVLSYHTSCFFPLLLRQCVYRLHECEHHQTNTRPLPEQCGHPSEDHTQVRAWQRLAASVLKHWTCWVHLFISSTTFTFPLPASSPRVSAPPTEHVRTNESILKWDVLSSQPSSAVMSVSELLSVYFNSSVMFCCLGVLKAYIFISHYMLAQNLHSKPVFCTLLCAD